MNTLKAILTRRSIRQYKKKKVSKEKINQILKAAMYAPSAMNYQPWHFIVLDRREDIDHLYKINPHAEMLLKAPLVIIVCGDLKAEMNIDYLGRIAPLQHKTHCLQYMNWAWAPFGLALIQIKIPLRE